MRSVWLECPYARQHTHAHTHTHAHAQGQRQIGCGFYTPNIQLRRGRSPVTGYGCGSCCCLLPEGGRDGGRQRVSGPLAGTVDTWAQAVVFNMRINILFISLRFEFYFIFFFFIFDSAMQQKREKRKRAAKNWKSPAPTTSSVTRRVTRKGGRGGVGEGTLRVGFMLIWFGQRGTKSRGSGREFASSAICRYCCSPLPPYLLPLFYPPLIMLLSISELAVW